MNTTTREEAERAELERTAFEAWWKPHWASAPFSMTTEEHARMAWLAACAQFKPAP